jgi:hypothetical protein
MLRSLRHLAWLPLFALLLGCFGKSPPATVRVSGKVTMDNRPLAHAIVTFSPSEVAEGTTPQSSTGRTDEQGNYSLKLDTASAEGAVTGKHRVRVAVIDRGGDGKPSGKSIEKVPVEYNTKTTLSFTVPPEGTSEANFSLSSHPKSTPTRHTGG